MVGIVCLLAHLWSGRGHASHEHPKSAFSWGWSSWEAINRHPDCEHLVASVCRWGAPYRKDTGIQRVRGTFCKVLDVQCLGGRERVVLQGSLTAAAAEYPEAMCEAWATAAKAQYDDERAESQLEALEERRLQRRGECEMMWLNEFVASADWEVRLSKEDRKPLRVKVKELGTSVAAQRVAAAKFPGRRHATFMDSIASIGVGGQRRSSSNQLNKRTLGGLPEFLGFDHYPGYLFAPTRLLPADDPSRFAPLRKPGQDVPAWVTGVTEGLYEDFDRRAVLPKQKRACSEWAQFVTKIAFVANIPLSPKKRPFDSMLGYPGEGPLLLWLLGLLWLGFGCDVIVAGRTALKVARF
jgi:hypothetical protein